LTRILAAARLRCRRRLFPTVFPGNDHLESRGFVTSTQTM
jgi:hypothetical protein